MANALLYIIFITTSQQKKDIGGEDAEFGFPRQVLNFIRHIAPGDVKGEIREVNMYVQHILDRCEFV
jgi:hypothetical protein